MKITANVLKIIGLSIGTALATAAVTMGMVDGLRENRPAHHGTVVQTTDDVASFNNGYSEAMSEACKAGGRYACDWLAHTAK